MDSSENKDPDPEIEIRQSRKRTASPQPPGYPDADHPSPPKKADIAEEKEKTPKQKNKPEKKEPEKIYPFVTTTTRNVPTAKEQAIRLDNIRKNMEDLSRAYQDGAEELLEEAMKLDSSLVPYILGDSDTWTPRFRVRGRRGRHFVFDDAPVYDEVDADDDEDMLA